MATSGVLSNPEPYICLDSSLTRDWPGCIRAHCEELRDSSSDWQKGHANAAECTAGTELDLETDLAVGIYDTDVWEFAGQVPIAAHLPVAALKLV